MRDLFKRIWNYEVPIDKLLKGEPDVHEGEVLPAMPARSPDQPPLTLEELRLQQAHRTGLVRNRLQEDVHRKAAEHLERISVEIMSLARDLIERAQEQLDTCQTDFERESMQPILHEIVFAEFKESMRETMRDADERIREAAHEALDRKPTTHRHTIETRELTLQERLQGTVQEVKTITDG